ncbi:unnamed protein product [Pieris brassicae]|uniref:Defensin n=1 Tax=Pieris brassicae TaxID=7116 RepID=A0A9P0TX49_PIEBR|nr:unnamed protein product [Pieris brassicae]
MKFLVLVAFFAALVFITQASPIAEEIHSAELSSIAVEPMEMLNSAPRSCTPSSCYNLCRRLGWRTGSCNGQRQCVCRR